MSAGDLDVDLTRRRSAAPRVPVDGGTERTGEMPAARRRMKHRAAARRHDAPRNDNAPIAVLTTDAALPEALRSAVVAQHRIATASSLDEAIELAGSGRCGILITDQIETQPVMRRMMQRLRERDPALVVVAVGNSSDQAALIALLSAGVVDRLMLKPVTPALAQIVLKSAAEQYRTSKLGIRSESAASGTEAVCVSQPELVSELPQPQPAVALEEARASHLPWIGVVAAAAVIVAGMAAWTVTRTPDGDPQARVAADSVTANSTEEATLDPSADRFAAAASIAIAKGEIASAIVALENVRRLQPEHSGLTALEAELIAAQERYASSLPRRQSVTTSPPREQSAKAPPVLPVAASIGKVRVDSSSAISAPAGPVLEAEDGIMPVDEQRELTVDVARTTGLSQPGAAADFGPPTIEPPALQLAPVEPPGVAAPPVLKLSRIVRPKYPQQALLSGAEGWVNVSLSVTPTGDVLDPRIEESSNGQLFDRAALAAVRKWRYEPYEADGPDATQRVTVRVNFRLQDRRRR